MNLTLFQIICQSPLILPLMIVVTVYASIRSCLRKPISHGMRIILIILPTILGLAETYIQIRKLIRFFENPGIYEGGTALFLKITLLPAQIGFTCSIIIGACSVCGLIRSKMERQILTAKE